MGTLGTNTPYSVGDIQNAVVGTYGGQAAFQVSLPGAGTHGTADAGTGVVQQVGGVYVSGPTANASGDLVRLWVDAYGYPVVHRETVVVGSITTAGSASTGTGTVLGIGAFRDLDAVINISFATGAVATLNVLFDSRLDGTNWANIAQTPIMTATGSWAVHLTRTQVSTITTASADAGAGTFRPIGWADDIRTRLVVTGTATTTLSATVTINFIE